MGYIAGNGPFTREPCPQCQDDGALFRAGKCQRTGCTYTQPWAFKRAPKPGRLRNPLASPIGRRR